MFRKQYLEIHALLSSVPKGLRHLKYAVIARHLVQVSCGAFEEIRENMVRATASNEAEETPSIGDSAKDDTGGCCAIQEEEEDDLSDDEAEGVHNQNQDAVKGVFPQLQVGAETKVQREEVDDRAEVLQQWEAIDQVWHTSLEPSDTYYLLHVGCNNEQLAYVEYTKL